MRNTPSSPPPGAGHGQGVTPFPTFSAAIRKIIYTTNAVESLKRVLRKALKTKGSFLTEEAATNPIFLTSHRAAARFASGLPPVINWP